MAELGPIQVIRDDSAFIHKGKRYGVITDNADNIDTIAQTFLRNAGRHESVFELTNQGFVYQGETFRASYVPKSGPKRELDGMPGAAALINEVARGFISGLKDQDKQASEISRATFDLSKRTDAAAKTSLKYYTAAGVRSTTTSFTYDVAAPRAAKINDFMRRTRPHLHVNASYHMDEAQTEVGGFYGFKNDTRTTCYAGAALAQNRALYAMRDRPELDIYTHQAERVVNQAEVTEMVQTYMPEKHQRDQQDTAEFSLGMYEHTGAIRLPTNVLPHYPWPADDRVRHLRPVDGEVGDAATARAHLLEFSDGDHANLDAFKAASTRMYEGLDADPQVALRESLKLPENLADWDVTDHLAFVLTQLPRHESEDPLWSPDLRSDDIIMPSPYGQLGRDRLSRELEPFSIKEANSLGDMVGRTTLADSFRTNDRNPDFVPLTIRRYSTTRQKTTHEVEIAEQIEINGTQYDVVGLVRHIGPTLNSGHYIGYSKLPDGTWAEFNDDKVRARTFEQVQDTARYDVQTLLLRRHDIDAR